MKESTQEKREKNGSQGRKSALRSKEESDNARRESLAKVASIVALVAAGFTVSFTLSTFFKRGLEIRSPFLSASSELKSLEATLAKQERSISDIVNRLQTLSNADPRTDAGIQIAALRSDVEAFAARIQTLENGLFANPEKALSVPLLRNDLENLKQAYKNDIETMVRNTDRVYDQNKWFIGLMFTMAIGLIGLAVSNFFQIRKKPEE